jgi:hypothetical protein
MNANFAFNYVFSCYNRYSVGMFIYLLVLIIFLSILYIL